MFWPPLQLPPASLWGSLWNAGGHSLCVCPVSRFWVSLLSVTFLSVSLHLCVFLWLAYSSSFYFPLFLHFPNLPGLLSLLTSWGKILYIYNVFNLLNRIWCSLFLEALTFSPSKSYSFFKVHHHLSSCFKPENHNHHWFLFPSHAISNPLASPVGSLPKTYPKSIHFTHSPYHPPWKSHDIISCLDFYSRSLICTPASILATLTPYFTQWPEWKFKT